MNISFSPPSVASPDRDSIAARNAILRVGDFVTLKIRRCDPDSGEEVRYDTFEIPYQKHMRVLDALNFVSENLSSDVSYRWFCGSKMCGTCAIRMNGREVLACWEAVEPTMVLEPLRNLPVVRDLVVDRTPYESKVASLEPWIERPLPYAGFPEPLSHREMKNASKALDCISCMSCYSACPVVGLGDLTDFAGPAPLVQLAQTALDPRNDESKVRQALGQTGIFNCVSCYKCEEVCPAKIPIVSQIIEPLKARTARAIPSMAEHSLTFRSIIARRGKIDPTELVLRVQGFRALLNVRRALTLLLRRKINPIRTLIRRGSAAASAAARILSQEFTRK